MTSEDQAHELLYTWTWICDKHVVKPTRIYPLIEHFSLHAGTLIT